jgi:hypothetical protein
MAHGGWSRAAPDQLARTAFNGEPLSIELDGWLPRTELARLEALDQVNSVRHSDVGLTVVVDDQAVVETLRQSLTSAGVSVGEIKPLEPSFDDIFVHIIEEYETRSEQPS